MELLLCLDVSNSMLAEDHDPNRLELAKRSMQQVIRNLGGDRVGVIVFAGEAYTTLPLTTDYEAAKIFVDGISTGIVTRQGTAIGAAIDLGLASFSGEPGVERALVIITDGEDHEGGAPQAVRRANEAGVVVHAVGIGSSQGAPIPLYRGSRKVGFRQDKNGQTVISALNVGMLEELVAVSGGVLVRAGSSDAGLQGLLDRIAETEKAELDTETFKEYHHRFWWFVLVGTVLLIWEQLIRERRQRWSRGLNLLDS
jgi:Ca-activated chloride channel family protein